MLVLESLKRYRGANCYSAHPVITGRLQYVPPLPEGLSLEIDQLSVARCDKLLRDGGPGEMAPELKAGMSAEAAIQAITMSLMSWAGIPGIEPSEWTDSHPGEFAVLAEPEPLSRECISAAVHVLALAMAATDADTVQELGILYESIGETARKHLLPIQTGALALACQRRGIGWRRFNRTPPIFLLGEGARQCRLDLSVSTTTSRLATEIARDKHASNGILSRYGIPVSQQVIVRSADAAWQAARGIGLPVVIKPRQGNMGKGVSVQLNAEADVLTAVKRAQRISKDVIVETYLPGDDHRILVAGGRVVAVARRMPAHVVGDGVCSIRELLDHANADPRRSKSYRTMLMTIEFDSESEQLVAARGYDLDTVPPKGDFVLLKSAANWTAGGTTQDLTDRIHPENARMVVRATELIGLDIAGVDLLIPDIARSYREVGGGICEVNYRPGILVHISADGGEERDVAGDLVDAICTQPKRGRVPTVVVCYPSGGDELCAGIAAALREKWQLRTACYTARGLILDGWLVSNSPAAAHEAYELAVCDPTIDAIVFSVEPDQMRSRGLGLPRADIVVIPEWDAVTSPDFSRGPAETTFRHAGAMVLENADPATCAATLMERFNTA